MKTMKKVLSIALTLLLVAALAVPALAATKDPAEGDPDNVVISINQPEGSEFTEGAPTYTAYKIFDAVAADDADLTGTEPADKVAYTLKDATTNTYYAIRYFENTEGEAVFALKYIDGTTGQDAIGQTTCSYTVSRTDAKFDEEDVKALAQMIINNVIARGDLLPTVTSEQSPFTLPESGYYLIVSSLGTEMMVDTFGQKTVTITEKNELPTVAIGIQGTGQMGTVDTPIVDDAITSTMVYEKGTISYLTKDVSWRLGVKIPLTVEGPLTIKVHGENITMYDFLSSNETHITYQGQDTGSDATITIDAELVKQLIDTAKEAGKSYATYDGIWVYGYLNATEANGVDPVTKGTLSATLEYKNYTSATKTTELTTGKVEVVKTDKDNKIIDGAKFQLWSPEMMGSGSFYHSTIKLSQRENGNYYVDPNGTITEFQAGHVVIEGLGCAADWQLNELEAPAGYNALTAPKKFTPSTDFSVEGGVKVHPDGEDTIYDDGGVQVINYTGAELPSTGGIGTTIFYIVGGLLVAGAAVLLVTKKRVQA